MQSGIVSPSVFDHAGNPDPIYVYGEPVCNGGLCNRGAVNGLGLVTRGTLWQYYDLWFDVDYYSNLTTTWTDCTGGIYGDYLP